MKKKILVVLESGFEEIETIAPVDLLRRAGAEVVLAACGDALTVEGKTGVRIVADVLLTECQSLSFDALVVPGGPAARELRKNPDVLALVRRFADAGLLTAAICAAPVVLLDAGVLEGKRFTAHFSVAEELPALLPDPVVCDWPLITSQGAGTAIPFGLAIVERLYDGAASREIAQSICLPGAQ